MCIHEYYTYNNYTFVIFVVDELDFGGIRGAIIRNYLEGYIH